MVFNFNKEQGIIKLYLKCRGVCIMSMKITKKILAGTLALMNTFTAVSAEPVKVEKPTDSSISTKEDKKPNRESIWKKIAKGTAITAGVTATVVGAAMMLAGGEIMGSFELFSKMGMEDRNFFCILYDVLYGYSVSNSNIRKYIRNDCKNTELRQALMYLFRVLDGEEVSNKECIEKNLKLVYNSYSDCEKLFSMKCGEYCGFSYTEYDTHYYYSGMIYIDLLRSSGEFTKSYCLKDYKQMYADSNYELNAIIFYVDHCDPIDKLFSCIRDESGNWTEHSFAGGRRSVDETTVERLLNINRNRRLIYKKKI